MPIVVRRFGAGFRRPEGPPGTHGLTAQVIHSDARGLISELAFARGGALAPHANPNTTWFCVIEGGGWVLVGDERRRIAAGEAVLWAAGITHTAWTDHGEMRAIIVEFAGPDDDTAVVALPDGVAQRLGAGGPGGVAKGDGHLVDRPANPERHDPTTGEPF